MDHTTARRCKGALLGRSPLAHKVRRLTGKVRKFLDLRTGALSDDFSVFAFLLDLV